jgi:hypothetical protein
MADTNKAHEKEVKVEDLLRLKRAERPSEAFWNTFDRELHQRMLQTLVKKDPWYVQALRGISGRIAQTAAVGAAAAFLAMMIVRPAFVTTTAPSNNGAQFAQEAVASVPQVVDVAMSDLEDLDSILTSDYQIEAISGSITDSGYANEYAPDSFEVASYDSEVYVMDAAAFAGTGLAVTFVY